MERPRWPASSEMAMGSASELRYHLLLAHNLKLLKARDYPNLDGQTTEVQRMLLAFMRKLTPTASELPNS